MSVLTKRQKREVEEAEGQARRTIAEIIPLLGEIPEAAIPSVKEHLDQALAQAKKAVKEVEKKDKKED